MRCFTLLIYSGLAIFAPFIYLILAASCSQVTDNTCTCACSKMCWFCHHQLLLEKKGPQRKKPAQCYAPQKLLPRCQVTQGHKGKTKCEAESHHLIKWPQCGEPQSPLLCSSPSCSHFPSLSSCKSAQIEACPSLHLFLWSQSPVLAKAEWAKHLFTAASTHCSSCLQ